MLVNRSFSPQKSFFKFFLLQYMYYRTSTTKYAELPPIYNEIMIGSVPMLFRQRIVHQRDLNKSIQRNTGYLANYIFFPRCTITSPKQMQERISPKYDEDPLF